MRQPDANHFIQAMEEEIRAHDHWEIVSREDVPLNIPVLPDIWSMMQMRQIDTHEVYKWKVRLTPSMEASKFME